MSAILPGLNVDCSDKKLSRYFLPYQMAWINDEARMRLAEKSVRIGWTYADALKNSRKRLRNKNRDYLFATKDQASAVEYMRTCLQIFKLNVGLAIQHSTFNAQFSMKFKAERALTTNGHQGRRPKSEDRRMTKFKTLTSRSPACQWTWMDTDKNPKRNPAPQLDDE
jgi:hypothetical protein